MFAVANGASSASLAGRAVVVPRVVPPFLTAWQGRGIAARRFYSCVEQRTFCTGVVRDVSSAGSSQPVSSASSTAPAPVETGGAGVPALQQTGIHGIAYRGPIDEDDKGSARVAPKVGHMWSNIPNHIRESFKSHASTDDAPKPAAPVLMDGYIAKARALVAQAGLAPVSWARAEGDAAHYYGGLIPLEPYKKGQTAAYHYPRCLVPRDMAHRFPLEMYVDPVYQTSNPNDKHKMNSATLFPRLQGKTTLLFIFSGQPLSGLWTGLRQWLDSVGDDFQKLPKTQVFKLHMDESWWSRKTSVLTKFHLRRQVEEDELFTTFVYRGKWKMEYVHALHLYNKALPVVLLVDHLGYVRWHAVGVPSDDATAVFNALAPRLAKERRGTV